MIFDSGAGLIVTQGVWAVLFVALLRYVLTTDDKRDQLSREAAKEHRDSAARREDLLLGRLAELTKCYQISCQHIQEMGVSIREVSTDLRDMQVAIARLAGSLDRVREGVLQ